MTHTSNYKNLLTLLKSIVDGVDTVEMHHPTATEHEDELYTHVYTRVIDEHTLDGLESCDSIVTLYDIMADLAEYDEDILDRAQGIISAHVQAHYNDVFAGPCGGYGWDEVVASIEEIEHKEWSKGYSWRALGDSRALISDYDPDCILEALYADVYLNGRDATMCGECSEVIYMRHGYALDREATLLDDCGYLCGKCSESLDWEEVQDGAYAAQGDTIEVKVYACGEAHRVYVGSELLESGQEAYLHANRAPDMTVSYIGQDYRLVEVGQ